MSITKIKRQLLGRFVNNKCENCQKKDYNLEAHRLKRGCEGGTYEHRNIKMLCSGCHKKMHCKEFR